MKAEIKKGHDILFSEGHSNDWNDLGDLMIVNFMNKLTFKGFEQKGDRLLIETTEGEIDIVFTGEIPTLEIEYYCKDQLVFRTKTEDGVREWLRKQNRELKATVMEQKELIDNMRDVLRFCARSNVGSYYQQQSAKKMLLDNEKIVWDRCNPDGTYNEDYKSWLFECGGQDALDANEEEEKSLFKE